MKKLFILIAMLTMASCTARHQALTPQTGLANPASVYCVKIGGKSVMVNTKGGVTGNCILPSGKEVDEWSLYRHAHHKN
ncbi:hypothetical protein SAMN05216516_101541 [Izhakiella capsodis]|uniref:Hemolysin n=1 Tax=Izhakiella capsodis TaxID=1367852 RepID=A0A1I4V4B0_9GAMM|nr:DUF333 domain-containing protein [Izhakiella capsodis]SFM96039.1 hypothetical protein SAMN05216516_101541 [Izhakiella capsodis]